MQSVLPGRAPHGARGLKYAEVHGDAVVIGSRPARGAWIEMAFPASLSPAALVAPRTGRVD